MDQYLVFPAKLKFLLSTCTKDTLFVFTDQALGPLVPIFRNKKHVIHCHDFLALQSAKGNIQENVIGWTGKQYQALIKHGFITGKNFISVSENTSKHLNSILTAPIGRNEVVYNGVSGIYSPVGLSLARGYVYRETGITVDGGYILHVGGNQWYKNRIGVVEIYNAWRSMNNLSLPLLLIGEVPSKQLKISANQSEFKRDIHFLTNKDSEFIRNAYSGAEVLLFPSLAEGFGWPIAEAMACGCQVITTKEAPMTEVGKDAAFYIERRPQNENEISTWANTAAKLLQNILCSSGTERQKRIDEGFRNVMRFNENETLDRIERIYQSVVETN
jgi:glycosyltransferase involved in cell wall biosynthesis